MCGVESVTKAKKASCLGAVGDSAKTIASTIRTNTSAPTEKGEAMAELICSNCRAWRYDRYTEEKYGMGVGICNADGTDQFCEHKCAMCVPIEGWEDYDG